MAVTDFLERGALINPDGLCVVMGEKRYTYRQMVGLMNRIANGLVSLGYGLNRNAAVLSDNHPEGYACSLGIMRSGMAYVPMDFRNSAEDNFRILDWGDAEVLFYGSRFHDQVLDFRDRLPKLQHLICLDHPLEDISGLMDWCSAFPDGSPKVEIPAGATSWLQTGSGTSGDFKMAMIPHRAYHSFTAYQSIWLADPQPVMLVAAPITHAGGGLSYRVIAAGGTLILMEKPDPQAVLKAIEELRITSLFLPPTVIYRLLDQPNVRDFDYRSLRCLAYSAAPMSVEKLRLALDVFGPVLAQGYGQTEALGIAHMTPEEHFIDGQVAPDSRLSACGRPALPFCRTVIMNDENEILPQGATGEICVRGDQVMAGYYKNPYATRKTIIDGWCHTGDVGFFDEEGYLHINDRKKDLIITGGFNVYPTEIEQAITSFEAVSDCAVIGVPDENWGEAVKAVVELAPGKTVTGPEIMARVKERLGSVKAPKSVDFITELPRSARGKVLKRALRERYWQGKTRKI
ncbi:MAG: AMP-binding protein [Deltaproteobacteria bacterium]|nr:AMP-binding protein [Deltaproteobacteria bacterium]